VPYSLQTSSNSIMGDFICEIDYLFSQGLLCMYCLISF
jgi:hypothetical protein